MTVISAWWRLNIRFQRFSRRSCGRWVYYLTQLSLGPRAVASRTPRGWETRFSRESHNPTEGGTRKTPDGVASRLPRGLEMRCGRKSHTRPRGPPESPDGVDPNIRRTRHNVTVITVGSKYEVYVRSSASSHMLTFRNLAIKWEVNIFLKKSFLHLYHASFIHASVFDVVSCCDAEWTFK